MSKCDSFDTSNGANGLLGRHYGAPPSSVRGGEVPDATLGESVAAVISDPPLKPCALVVHGTSPHHDGERYSEGSISR